MARIDDESIRIIQEHEKENPHLVAAAVQRELRGQCDFQAPTPFGAFYLKYMWTLAYLCFNATILLDLRDAEGVPYTDDDIRFSLSSSEKPWDVIAQGMKARKIYDIHQICVNDPRLKPYRGQLLVANRLEQKVASLLAGFAVSTPKEPSSEAQEEDTNLEPERVSALDSDRLRFRAALVRSEERFTDPVVLGETLRAFGKFVKRGTVSYQALSERILDKIPASTIISELRAAQRALYALPDSENESAVTVPAPKLVETRAAQEVDPFQILVEGSAVLRTLENLPHQVRRAVMVKIAKLEAGLTKGTKKIVDTEGTFESRIFLGSAVRIYWAFGPERSIIIRRIGEKDDQARDFQALMASIDYGALRSFA